MALGGNSRAGAYFLAAILAVGVASIAGRAFYNLMKKVLNTLLAVQALLFVFALNPSVRVKD